MTRSLNCYTIENLQTTVTTYNPAYLIDYLGADVYDMWLNHFMDTHIIFNFTLKYFCHDDRIQDIISVSYSSWYRYRAQVFDTTCDLFPDSATFAQAQNRALPDRASSHRSSASSQKSFESAPHPPTYTRVSPTVLTHEKLNLDQAVRSDRI